MSGIRVAQLIHSAVGFPRVAGDGSILCSCMLESVVTELTRPGGSTLAFVSQILRQTPLIDNHRTPNDLSQSRRISGPQHAECMD